MNNTLIPKLNQPSQSIYTDVMIDLELLGLDLGRPIIQVGMCFFDLESEKPMERAGVVRLSVRTPADANPCVETMKWWKETNGPLYDELFNASEAGPLPAEAMEQLRLSVLTYSPMRVWADYPQFDIAQINLVMEKTGVRKPWSHRQVHSSSTVLQTCSLLTGGVPVIAPHEGRVEHEAGSDAYQQAMELCVAYRLLRESRQAVAKAA